MKYFICISFMLVAHLACAQDDFSYDQFLFKKLTVDEGLSYNRVNHLCQDNQGYIWIATQRGLNRFDGYTIKSFVTGDGCGLAEGPIESVFCDSRGQIWVGSSVLQKYDKATERFKLVAFPDDSIDRIEQPRSILEDNKGIICVLSFNKGLFQIDVNKNKCHSINIDPDYTLADPERTYEYLYLDYSNDLWIGTITAGLIKYNNLTGHYTHYPNLENDPTSVSGVFISSIYQDSKNRLWVGTFDSGVNLFNPQDSTFKRYVIDASNPISQRIKTIFEDLQGNLILGTRGGLYQFDQKNQRFIRVAHTNHPFSVLNYNSVTCSFIDQTDVLWIGTFAGGVNYADLRRTSFLHHKAMAENTKYLNDKGVYSFAEDSKGHLYVGTDQGGVNIYNRKTQRYTYLKNNPQKKNSLSFNDVKALIVDEQENLWIGTNNGGLNYYNTKTRHFKIYQNIPGDESSLASDKIFSMYLDKEENKIWLGTTSGLSIFDIDKKSFENIFQKEQAHNQLSLKICAIYKDKHGIYWVRASRVDKYGNHLECIFPESVPLTFQVNAIAEDLDSNIWLASSHGLLFYDYSDSSSYLFTTEHGLPSSKTEGLLIDDSNKVWLSTDRGIIKISKGTDFPYSIEIKPYTVGDGLQGNQFNTSACFKSSSGIMYFGGINGFNSFNPAKKEAQPTQPPNVVITSLEISNSPVHINEEIEGHIVLRKPINVTNHITLTDKQDNFALEFSAMHFSSSEENSYVYMMRGYDNRWQEINHQRKVRFTNLDPGEYTFLVKAANYNGDWNNTPTELIITILPPWWETILFRVVILFTVLASIFIVLRLRYQAIKKRNIWLEKQVTLKTAEIQSQKDKIEIMSKKVHEADQAKLRFFINISHDFRTPLTVLLGHFDLLYKKYGTRENITFKTIRRNISHLHNLINDLLEIRKADTEQTKISISQFDINETVGNAYNSFLPVAEKKNIILHFNDSGRRVPVFLDKGKVVKILQNLLSNAIKYTPAGKSISLELDDFAENVEIRIADKGIGIAPEHQKQVFNRFYRTPDAESGLGHGIGLALVKSYVDIQNGEIEVNSSPGKGTEFRITFPKEDNNLKNKSYHKPEKDIEIVAPEFEPEDPVAPAIREELTNSASILVVEDNHDLRDYIVKILSPYFFVITAENGVEGVKKLESKIPQVIISDLMMPEMDGIKFCKHVKSNILTSHIPFIILTAKEDPQTQIDGFKLGIDDYVLKPFNTELLITRVTNLIEKRKAFQDDIKTGKLDVQESDSLGKLDKELLIKIQNLVHEHYTSTDFSIEFICENIGMSRSTFFKKYKDLTGATINDYIKLVRLNKAVELLKNKDVSVSDISYRIGYQSRSHFSSVFKNEFKVSPREFHENWLNKL